MPGASAFFVRSFIVPPGTITWRTHRVAGRLKRLHARKGRTMSVLDRVELYFVKAPLPAPFAPSWMPEALAKII